MKKQKIFVIGDSVSIHYGPYLKKLINHKFNYDRKRGIEQALTDLDKPIGANARDSGMVMEYLTAEYIKNTKYDILLINCGLHDARVDRASNKIQVKLEDYKMNLTKIIEISKSMANRTIWVGLTPVIDQIHNSREEGVLRYSKDIHAYDIAAKEIMEQNNIPCIDMYSFTKNLGIDIYSDHVHFKEEIRELQATLIADYLNCI
ncbi:SGNH/GDSL hydrolase family protein [Clostridium estertheticum]|uniref:SGNH/GDSL hydrolase family protein n=1 Tax=Clostridium estertheticum TaxID=238834 RepID=UPI0013E998F4|nr:SGNH/GDSL hydrolase family protein [Clostridium estertheticum]MBZ9687452.1 SGNH/GDSL hydrolase family protein [Clostridium estertheticum]